MDDRVIGGHVEFTPFTSDAVALHVIVRPHWLAISFGSLVLSAVAPRPRDGRDGLYQGIDVVRAPGASTSASPALAA